MTIPPSQPSSTLERTDAEPTEKAAFRRISGVAIGIGLALVAAYLVPGLEPMRPWTRGTGYIPFWNVVGREWLGEGARLKAEAERTTQMSREAEPPLAPSVRGAHSAPAPAGTAQVFPPYSPKVARPEQGIEWPEALEPYFRRLTLVDLGKPFVIARAGQWGDSILGLDGITSAIRRRLQGRFGDAGHGFHEMDRYNPSYRQQGIEFEPGEGWLRCLVVQECSKQDHRYGYGGLIARSSGGATSTWWTPKRGFGQTVSRFEVWFARQELGGRIEITVDGTQKTMVSTRGPHLEDGWHEVRVPPGPHRFTVRAAGGGEVRTYGVVLENDGPGAVWDGVALIGGSSRGLRTQDPKHIASQIRHRDTDLIVFMFGGNDMERNYVDLKTSMQPYYDEFGEVLHNFRAGKPGGSCLIMSLGDHGKRLANGTVVSRPFVKELVAAQREVARQNGCGFFDTFSATGGDGTVARWFRARPQLIAPDLGHATSAGHEVIGGLLANAVFYDYERYRARMEGKPLPELAGGAPQSADDAPGTVDGGEAPPRP